MAKRAYGLSWTVWMGAAALAAVEPALAETLTPLPEGNPAAIESTEASLSAAAQEDSAVDSSSGTSSGTSRPAADAVDENREAGGDSATEIPQAQPVAITNIQIEPTADGFSLRLEASGELTEPETSVTGNAAIADLSNAVLQLSDGDEFFVSDPVEGISLIDVSALPDNQVRIAITGINAPPTVTISVGTAGLVVSGAPGDPAAQALDDETIQIIVTGENEDDYFVPNASTATRTDTRILDIPQAIQ
ncbi:MAG: AMIN domain-containing protein, partial [Cyanobacteria bacterium P01_H01_bin.119]